MNAVEIITAGKACLGIEFGSTRIKACLVDNSGTPLATGSFDWENKYEHGVWTYSLEDIKTGLQTCYADLCGSVQKLYGVSITKLASSGISGMMHGYMPFDKNNHLLTSFRTWRNTAQEQASQKLTELFDFPCPQRWSVVHLYQAMLNNEAHINDISYITTLAVYVHYLLTGELVAGIGEASGMFPIDSSINDFDVTMLDKFDALCEDYSWNIRDVLPKVVCAGSHAGKLTEWGARLLDISGNLQAGTVFTAPEGDAGTGMAATNSVKSNTANVSAGTSIFAMAVLDKPLDKVHNEIDMVTTPDGKPVAMVHCNNCTSDINGWAEMFASFSKLAGVEVDMGKVYETLFKSAECGDADCGGLVHCNYLSGEHVTHFADGRPLFVRTPESKFTLQNFMRSSLYSAIATLKTGLDILRDEENVKLSQVVGHGGFFKTKGVGQSVLSSALDAPVSVMSTAGEGGAWGIALLAVYLVEKSDNESLGDFLDKKIFANASIDTLKATPEEVQGFEKYMESYRKCLLVERTAVENM